MTQQYEMPPLPKLPMNDPAAAHKILNDYGKACANAAIKADRQRRGEPVEDGWRLIAVNEVWDALERALNRACSKGYMPDAIGEEWNAFDWTEAPQPAEPSCDMGEHACNDRSQCWEPCGDLGKSVEHAEAAPAQEPSIVRPVTMREICPDCGHQFECFHNGYINELRAHVAPQPAESHVERASRIVDSWPEWKRNYALTKHDVKPTQPAEPVKVPSSFPTGTEYSVEPHGNGYAIYQGRDQFHHGLNLAHLTECTPEFSKRIESALNTMHEPEGWQLVPKEPTEQMLIDAMEASLLGRPSPDDDSYVRSIVAAWCEAAPKFGEEE